MDKLPDRRIIVCNFLEGTKAISKGAKARLYWIAGDAEHAFLEVQSRGGRWVRTWARLDRLGNFRFKSIPPGHPKYKSIDADATEKELLRAQTLTAR